MRATSLEADMVVVCCQLLSTALMAKGPNPLIFLALASVSFVSFAFILRKRFALVYYLAPV